MGEFIFLGEFRENRAKEELPYGGYYVLSPYMKVDISLHVEFFEFVAGVGVG